MKRKLILLCFLLIILTVLGAMITGCDALPSGSTGSTPSDGSGSNNTTSDTSVTVTYYLSETDATPISVRAINGVISLSPLPTREGYTFNGLFDAPTGGALYVDSYGRCLVTIERPIILYAQWTGATQTIVFDGQGVTVPTESATMNLAYGSTVTTFPELVKPGYAFKGWADADGNLYSNGSAVLKEKQTFTTDHYTIENNSVTLYAVFESSQLVVTFDFNDGTYQTQQFVTEYGGIIPEDRYPKQDTGSREIVGWTTFIGNTQPFNGTVTENLTLYAIWKDYRIFTLDSMAGSTAKIKVYKDQSFKLSGYEGFVRQGYSISGWYATAHYSGNPITEITYGADSPIYYAKWERATYTLTFDPISAGQTLEAITYQMGASISLPVLTKDGYTFNGWYTNATLTGKPIHTVTPDFYGSYTLYASFTADVYTITLEHGGTLAENASEYLLKYGDIYELPIPSRVGYQFLGWCDESQTLYTDTEGKSLLGYGILGDLTLYPKWQPNISGVAYTVTYVTNSDDTIADQKYASGALLVFPNEPTNANLYFAGWYNEDFTEAYSEQIPVTSDMTLYAKWSEVNMQAAYDSTIFTGILADAVEFNGNYYKFFKGSFNWIQAKNYCEAMGGHLATITTAEENAMVAELHKTYGNFFLGASDAGLEGVWKWVTDEPWNYSNFGKNEPNGGTGSNYLAYYNGAWDDTNSSSYSFLCEWEAQDIAAVEENYATVTSTNILYNNAFYYAGHLYQIYNYTMTYNEAKTYCERLGGHLAIIDSMEENSALFAYVNAYGNYAVSFGATDAEVEGTWVWANGEVMTESNWAANEPNNSGDEDCFRFGTSVKDGTWADADWGNLFMCEWDYWKR